MTLILQLDVTFFCGSQCFLPPGEDVRGGGGDLHGVLDPLPHYNDNNNDKNDYNNNNYKILGVLGSLPHLLHPLLPLSSDRSQGVDLQCLPGGDAFHTL